MELKILLAGLGGQGVVFLTRILARTALNAELPVMVSETHGMSQRGGSVVSHLKIGGDKAPLIMRGTADLLFALEADEAVRHLPHLRKGGIIFANAENGLRPDIDESLEKLSIVAQCLPASRMAVELGAAAVANVVLAGFAAAHPDLPFSLQQLQATIKSSPARGIELNLRALESGFHVGQNELQNRIQV